MDCCSDRDLYHVNIYGGATLLYSGTLDDRAIDNSIPDGGSGGPGGPATVELASSVPEPSTWAMMLLGFAELALPHIANVTDHIRVFASSNGGQMVNRKGDVCAAQIVRQRKGF